MSATLLDINVLVALASHHRGRVVTFDVPLRAHAAKPATVHVLAP